MNRSRRLWQRNLGSLWICQFLVTVGLTVIVPLLPFYIEELGATDPADNRLWSGLALAAPAFPLMLAAPLWGRFGDRHGRKWMVVRAVLGIAISVLLMGVAQTPLQFLLCRFLQGTLGGVDDAAAAFAGTQAPPEVRGKAMGILQSATAAGALVGPLIGGFLAVWWGFSTVILATGFLISLSGLNAALVLSETKQTPTQHRPQLPLTNAVTSMFRQRNMRAFILAGVCIQIGAYGLINIFALHIRSLLPNPHDATSWVGALQAITWGATLVGAAWWGRRNDHGPVARNFTLAACGGALSLFCQAWSNHTLWFIPMRIAQGFCQSALGQTIYLQASRSVVAGQQGIQIGIANSFLTLGQVLGALVGVVVAEWFSTRWIFLLMGGCFVLGALLVWQAEYITSTQTAKPEQEQEKDSHDYRTRVFDNS